MDLRKYLYEEYDKWVKSNKDFSKVVNNKIQHAANLRGYIVRKNNGWRTVFMEIAEKLSDIRKWTGLCSNYASRMRVLGFDMFPCILPLPDFNAVPANALQQALRGLGTIGVAAARIVNGLNLAGLYSSYSDEQKDAMLSIVEMLEKDIGIVILDMPTGSGKTESFLIPAIANAMTDGMTIIVYPRKALASNQLERIVKLYYGLTARAVLKDLPFVDVYDGYSCVPPGQLSRLSSQRRECKGQARVASINIGVRSCIVEYSSHPGYMFMVRCGTNSYVLPVTDARLGAVFAIKPRIIITNYDMLNRLAAGIQAVALDDLLSNVNPRRLLIVFDEAHEFQGIEFKHLLLLLARVYDIALSKNIPVTLVFSSATLPQNFDKMVEKLVEAVSTRTTNGSTPRVKIVSFKGSHMERVILVTMMLPDPQTAGQWLAQLAAMQVTTAWESHPSRPAPQAILFVDSLRYLNQISQGLVKTLYLDADTVLKEHVPDYAAARGCRPNISLLPEQDWSDLLSRAGDPAKVAANIVNLLTGNPEFLPRSSKNICEVRGALAKHYADYAHRKSVEEALSRPCPYPRIVAATSTLEMGVDLPAVNTIIQFRRPMSEASNMQRLGRIARRGSTLYTGIAIYALTSNPRDALLLLDEDLRRRYFYGCKNLGGNKPSVNAPANLAILKQHIFLHAISLSKQSNIRRMLGSKRGNVVLPRDIDKVKDFVKEILGTIELNGNLKRLERVEKAVKEAYASVGLSDVIEGLLSGRSVTELIMEDLMKALEKLKSYNKIAEEVCGSNLFEIAERLRKHVKDLLSLIGEHAEKIERTGSYSSADTGYARIAITDRELVKKLRGTEEKPGLVSYDEALKQLQETVSDLYKQINAILSIGSSGLRGLCILENIAERIEKIRKLLDNELRGAIEDIIERIQSTVDALDSIAELLGRDSEIASILSREFFEAHNRIVETSNELVDQLNQQLLSLIYQLINKLVKTMREDHISVILSEFVGEPYFNPNIRGTLRSVEIGYGCTISNNGIKCEETRSEEPASALYRLTPISETPAASEEAGFVFLPPWHRDTREVYFIAASSSTGYFVNQANYTEILKTLLRATYSYESLPASPNREVQLILGEDVRRANVYRYSTLAEMISRNVKWKKKSNKDGRWKPVSNVRYVAFKAPSPRDKRRTITLVLRLADRRGNPVKTYGSVPVALCTLDPDEPKVFFGIDIDKPSSANIGFVQCPLAETWYQLWKASKNDHRAKAGMNMLKKICSKVHECGRKLIKAQGKSSVELLASDVLTYLVRSFPVASTFIRMKSGRDSRPVAVKGRMVGLETYKASVEISYNWVRLNIRGLGDYVYSLPVRLTARLLDTYVAAIELDESEISRVVEQLMQDIASPGQTPSQPARIVLVKTLLTGLGALSRTAAKRLADEILDAARNSRMDDLINLMETVILLAVRVLNRVSMQGESYALTMSALAEATRLLLEAAADGSYEHLYKALASIAGNNKSRASEKLREALKLMVKLTLVHSIAYGVVNIAGYDDVIHLTLARFAKKASSGRGISVKRTFTLIEQREGGIGYLLTLRNWNLVADLIARAYNAGNNAMQTIINGRKNQINSLQVPANAAAVASLLRGIAGRVEQAYGVPGSYTYLPAWLVRIALTYDELKKLHSLLGGKGDIGVNEREWSRLIGDLLPAFFDTDFVDANEYHLAGVNSWLGDYEKRILMSFHLATTYTPAILQPQKANTHQ